MMHEKCLDRVGPCCWIQSPSMSLFPHSPATCESVVTSGVKDLCVQQSSLHQTACIYLEKEVHESCHSGLEMNMCILVDDWDICKELPMEFVLRNLAGKLTAAFHYNSNWCWCTIPDQEEPIIDTYNQGIVLNICVLYYWYLPAGAFQVEERERSHIGSQFHLWSTKMSPMQHTCSVN